MGNAEKQLVIVGAGKIAKSYLADIFGTDAGYHITFLTHRAEQARQMRQAGGYTLFKTHSDGRFDRVRISGYDAFGLDEEYEACVEAVSAAPYLALPIFPAAIGDMGVLISDAIKKRLAAGDLHLRQLPSAHRPNPCGHPGASGNAGAAGIFGGKSRLYRDAGLPAFGCAHS